MSETVSLLFRYAESDYVRALRAHYSSRLRVRLDIVAAIVGALFGAYSGRSPDSHWLSVICGAASCFLVFILFAAFVVIPPLAFRSEAKFRDDYSLTFSQDGIHFRTAHIDSQLQWSLYSRALIDGHSYVLYYGSRQFTVIPKRVFQSAEQQQIFELSPEAARVARRRNRLIPVAEAVLLLLAGAAAFWLVQGRSQRRAGPISYREVSFQPQMVFSAAFARDGRAIVYSAAREGNRPELYVIRPESPAPQPLGLRDTNLLSVSSKGDLAVLVHARYLFHRIFSGTLATMPLVGGAPREILEDVRQADWAADGASLAVIRGIGGRDRLEFPAGKLLYETSGWLSDLRISPGGDRIAFFEHPIRFDDRGSVAMVDLAGKKTTLSSVYSAERGIAWAPDGREVFFTAKDTAQPHIYGVSLAGERRVALEGAGWLTIHDIARNGEWLLTRDEIRADLLVLAPGERRERNVSWMDFSARPLLSADGRTLVFTEENGAIGLNYMSCVQKPPGSAVVQLGEGFAYDLSADGKWAAVIVPSTPQLFKLYPIGPGEPRTLERGTIESYATVQWFADQKRALVCGNEPGHATRCYVQEIAGGPPRKVTPEGTSDGLPSPDGRFVLVQNSAGEHMLYPLEGGEPR